MYLPKFETYKNCNNAQPAIPSLKFATDSTELGSYE